MTVSIKCTECGKSVQWQGRMSCLPNSVFVNVLQSDIKESLTDTTVGQLRNRDYLVSVHGAHELAGCFRRNCYRDMSRELRLTAFDIY